jgi:hypothetical protein
MLNEEIGKAGYVNFMTIPPNVKYQERVLKGIGRQGRIRRVEKNSQEFGN